MNAAAPAITPLHRHQIAWLTRAGWDRIRSRPWDAVAGACLAHWAAHRLPLVVTRRPPSDADTIALGLSAPGCWERRRIALAVPRREVLYFDEFPCAERVLSLLPDTARADWRRLCADLQATGTFARVYGSYGWTHFSGLDHVRAGSDIDVWIAVSDADQADAVAKVLASFAGAHPRLDGELVFDGRTAVAWREWLAWRAGRARSLLVKRIDGSALAESPWADRVPVLEAA